MSFPIPVSLGRPFRFLRVFAIGSLILSALFNATAWSAQVPRPTKEDLNWVARAEGNLLHLPRSVVLWVDFERVKADFPDLKNSSDEFIRNWILTRAAVTTPFQQKLVGVTHQMLNSDPLKPFPQKAFHPFQSRSVANVLAAPASDSSGLLNLYGLGSVGSALETEDAQKTLDDLSKPNLSQAKRLEIIEKHLGKVRDGVHPTRSLLSLTRVLREAMAERRMAANFDLKTFQGLASPSTELRYGLETLESYAVVYHGDFEVVDGVDWDSKQLILKPAATLVRQARFFNSSWGDETPRTARVPNISCPPGTQTESCKFITQDDANPLTLEQWEAAETAAKLILGHLQSGQVAEARRLTQDLIASVTKDDKAELSRIKPSKRNAELALTENLKGSQHLTWNRRIELAWQLRIAQGWFSRRVAQIFGSTHFIYIRDEVSSDLNHHFFNYALSNHPIFFAYFQDTGTTPDAFIRDVILGLNHVSDGLTQAMTNHPGYCIENFDVCNRWFEFLSEGLSKVSGWLYPKPYVSLDSEVQSLVDSTAHALELFKKTSLGWQPIYLKILQSMLSMSQPFRSDLRVEQWIDESPNSEPGMMGLAYLEPQKARVRFDALLNTAGQPGTWNPVFFYANLLKALRLGIVERIHDKVALQQWVLFVNEYAIKIEHLGKDFVSKLELLHIQLLLNPQERFSTPSLTVPQIRIFSDLQFALGERLCRDPKNTLYLHPDCAHWLRWNFLKNIRGSEIQHNPFVPLEMVQRLGDKRYDQVLREILHEASISQPKFFEVATRYLKGRPQLTATTESDAGDCARMLLNP